MKGAAILLALALISTIAYSGVIVNAPAPAASASSDKIVISSNNKA